MTEPVDTLDASARIHVVAEIYSKLKDMDLLDSQKPAILELRRTLNEYIRCESLGRKIVRGEIPFPEAQRVILYTLPTCTHHTARVVLEHRLPSFFA
jgi:hypothetical protein